MLGDLPRIARSEVVELGWEPRNQPTPPFIPPHGCLREWTRLTAIRAPTPEVILTREEGHLDLQGALESRFDLVLLRALCKDTFHPSIRLSI